MQMVPSEIAVVQISRIEYIMKCYHDMVDQILPKRQAMTTLWCSSIDTLCFPKKKKLARAISPPGVGATAILATKITW